MIPIANPQFGPAVKSRVESVLDSGLVADGPTVRDFESDFSDFCHVEHAVATSNGTTALHAALEGLGIGDGDTVITTPFSFVASANAIRLTGARPVFADINPDTYNIDPTAVAEILRERDDVAAILVVHLYGLPVDMDPILNQAGAYGVPVIEDAAQAHGGTYRGRPVGSIGDVGCFSFYPTKNMTTGEGGIVTTDDPAIAKQVRRFVNHGRNEHNEHVDLGHNYRMTSIAAAIGRVELDALPEYVEKRRENADQLTSGLADTPLTTPIEPNGRQHAYHQYTIRVTHRSEFRDALKSAGVDTGVYYPKTIPDHAAYDRWEVDVPVARDAAHEVVLLPVTSSLSESDLEHIIKTIKTHYDKG